jgi:hypothetical protein
MFSNRPSTEVSERRRETRQPLESKVRMWFDSEAIPGISDNISRVGLMLFTDEPLRVTVEVDVDGEPQTFTGRLIRAQRMNDSNTGIAIELDGS